MITQRQRLVLRFRVEGVWNPDCAAPGAGGKEQRSCGYGASRTQSYRGTRFSHMNFHRIFRFVAFEDSYIFSGGRELVRRFQVLLCFSREEFGGVRSQRLLRGAQSPAPVLGPGLGERSLAPQ